LESDRRELTDAVDNWMYRLHVGYKYALTVLYIECNVEMISTLFTMMTL